MSDKKDATVVIRNEIKVLKHHLDDQLGMLRGEVEQVTHLVADLQVEILRQFTDFQRLALVVGGLIATISFAVGCMCGIMSGSGKDSRYKI